MLFVLTGDVQTGKTRWLQSTIGQLAAEGIAPYGVIAPGVWQEPGKEDPAHVDENGFEKLGIDNVLLPEGSRIPFARRRDIAQAEGLLDPESQSSQANLKWCIDESALDRVNAHLARVRGNAGKPGAGMLVIDELGVLELLRGGGLVEALALLEQGPQPAYQHALVVVREQLLPCLDGRFEKWGERAYVSPDSDLIQIFSSSTGVV